jgi:hypothetical protein
MGFHDLIDAFVVGRLKPLSLGRAPQTSPDPTAGEIRPDRQTDRGPTAGRITQGLVKLRKLDDGSASGMLDVAAEESGDGGTRAWPHT